jgi:prolycopene isomerase
MPNYVRLVDKPFTSERLYENIGVLEREAMSGALRCRLCEHPSCTIGNATDIRGVMRRVSVGNFAGAKKCWQKAPADTAALERFEKNCIYALEGEMRCPSGNRFLSLRVSP